jgi:acetyl esterase/lipase
MRAVEILQPPPRRMRFALGSIAALAVMVAVGQTSTLDQTSAAGYEVTTRPGLVYAEHDGIRLVGDLYLPKSRAKAPALVAMHGGAWRAGTRAFYKYWGPFLARNGYALFTIEYRLGKPGAYPAAVYDVKAAVQFIRARAAEFDIDPDRIGLMGDSAGGQLAALLALAGDQFTSAYRDDPNAATGINVKAVVGFYGIYEMLAQWNHDTLAERKQELLAQKNQDLIRRPGDSITEEFLGVSPMQNREIYSESSPISYATADRNHVRFLLFHGSSDELVDPPSQSGAFLAALTQAGFFARLIMIPGAGHYWASEPFEGAPRSYGAMAAPQLLRFLESSL